MKLFGRLSILLLGAAFLPIFAQDLGTIDRINQAVRSGQLSESRARELKSYIWYGHADSIPMEYRSKQADKCGFGLAVDMISAPPIPKLSRDVVRLDSILYTHTFAAPAGIRRFNIHYFPSGTSAVPPTDEDENGIPDWVEKTAEYLEHSYRLQVDTLGYREPPSFARSGGSMYILISNLQFYYGETFDIQEFPPGSGEYASSIRLENDYIGGFYTHGYEALRVTCAHEFFHTVQLAYAFKSADLWYYELSSTWMEDVAHDDVNDYYGYLGSFFSSPTRSLSSTSGYETAHWNHFIEKRYNRDVIRTSWENIASYTALQAIDDAIMAIEDTSDGLERAFQQFAVWNYFTGYRSDSTTYYSEGRYYPLLHAPLSFLEDDSMGYDQAKLSAHYLRRSVSDSTYLNIDWGPADLLSLTTILERPGTQIVVSEWAHSPSVTYALLLPSDTVSLIFTHADRSASTVSFKAILDTKGGGFSGPIVSGLKAFPNPLHDDPLLKFSFLLKENRTITLEIFSVAGKKIFEKSSTNLPVGLYSDNTGLEWNVQDMEGNRVPSGVYVYRFKTKGYTKTGKIAVVR